jgi:hypothetical protein
VVKDDSVGAVERIISVDSSHVHAHQHAAEARKGGCAADRIEQLAVDGEALGRSRGGLTSKIHLAVDGRELPMSIIDVCPQLSRGERDGPSRTHGSTRRVVSAQLRPRTHALSTRGRAVTSTARSSGW